jgi:photosystem I P700 chlorophyll a apoprotein A2
MATKLFPKFARSANDPTTRRIWFGLAVAHDFEKRRYDRRKSLQRFLRHTGQLAIIFLWTSGNLFHVAWQGNFEQWVIDPVHVRQLLTLFGTTLWSTSC